MSKGNPPTDPVTLKPCPFCGGEAEIERNGTMRASMVIACADCGCRVESGDVGGLTPPERWKWNARSPGEPETKLPANVTRYKVVQDKGEYCLKGCADGDLVDYSAYAALLAKSPGEPSGDDASELRIAANHLMQEIEQVGHSDYGPECHICRAVETVKRITERKCEHTMVEGRSTLRVIDPDKAKCTVCYNFFDLPLTKGT